MYKKILFSVGFIMISFYGTAQKNINNYKYIIVPKTYEFSNSEDQYQLNSLTKFLYNKYGYEAFFSDEDLPKDLENNGCLALTSEVVEVKKNMFKTELEIVLKDCFDAVVMTSKKGISRKKEFDKAYTEALRGAFETFQNLNYKYVPKESVVEVVAVTPIKKLNNWVEEAPSDIKKTEKHKNVAVKPTGDKIYYAQAIENGFQLVNSEPKIVMILYATAAENVFLVKGKSAIVYKEDGFWYYSENDGKLGEKQQLNIKF